MTQALVYVEVDLPRCANVYGVAPCTASVTSSPPTGSQKCFQCRKTCQDIVNYVADDPLTIRFGMQSSYRPPDIDCYPSISEVSYTPAKISLGNDLGTRASVSITFTDHPDSDALFGMDPYLSTRTYNPWDQGTFFGKFYARYPFLQSVPLRLINGEVGDDLVDMEIRNFVIESFDGPTPQGKYTLTATDILKLADADRAQAPEMSRGYLLSAITATNTQLTVTPAGSGDDYTGGYLNIGGKEIVRYWIDGDEAENVLLLHMNGADASTTFTDSSASAHTVVATGNAQIDTAVSAFGTGAALFDGTGDYLLLDGSADFAFGTGDFTIDFWVRVAANGVAYFLYDSRPSATEGLYPTIYRGSDNSIRYYTNSADRIISGAGAIVTGSWVHVALVRASSVTKLYTNGILIGTYADTNSYLNGSQRPVIGVSGNNLLAGHNGWIDELRVTKGYARWSGAFTVPPAASPVSGSDVLNIPYRGALNTTADVQPAQSRAQHMLSYVSADPADIIADLWSYVPGFDNTYIDLATWQDETSTYNGNVYTGYVSEPTPVATLLKELIVHTPAAHWDDNVNQKLRLQVLHGVNTDAVTYTASDYLRGSPQTKEQPEQRISRVQIYFGQINPLRPLTDLDNFRSTTFVIDEDSEEDYGIPAIKTIQSRWIPELGRTVADRLAAIILGRYKNPPRHIDFDLMRGNGVTPELGGGYQFENAFVQDASGASSHISIQLTQINPRMDRNSIGAEEMLFDVPATDLANRAVSIDVNNYNLNLLSAHNSIYPAPLVADTFTVTFTVQAGVIVGSHSTSLYAIDVSSWPAGVTVNLVVLGRIQGKGGLGGAGFLAFGFGTPTVGSVGGKALYTRNAISLTDASGAIWGGGGGGGGGDGGGGGGAGQDGGSGGSGPTSGSPGTATSGGPGGGSGAAGGGPGLAGGNSTAAGGAAGSAIDGVSFVTTVGGAGDRRGGQIN